MFGLRMKTDAGQSHQFPDVVIRLYFSPTPSKLERLSPINQPSELGGPNTPTKSATVLNRSECSVVSARSISSNSCAYRNNACLAEDTGFLKISPSIEKMPPSSMNVRATVEVAVLIVCVIDSDSCEGQTPASPMEDQAISLASSMGGLLLLVVMEWSIGL